MKNKQQILKALEEKLLEAPPSYWRKIDTGYDSSQFNGHVQLSPVKGNREVGGYLFLAQTQKDLSDPNLSFSYPLSKKYVTRFVRRMRYYEKAQRQQLEERILSRLDIGE
jgi:hypothetical protein